MLWLSCMHTPRLRTLGFCFVSSSSSYEKRRRRRLQPFGTPLGFGRGLSIAEQPNSTNPYCKEVLNVKPYVFSPGQGLSRNEPNSDGTGRRATAKRGWSCTHLSADLGLGLGPTHQKLYNFALAGAPPPPIKTGKVFFFLLPSSLSS